MYIRPEQEENWSKFPVDVTEVCFKVAIEKCIPDDAGTRYAVG